jgi:hypothetical protein
MEEHYCPDCNTQLLSATCTTPIYNLTKQKLGKDLKTTFGINRMITHLLTESLTALATEGVSRVTLGSGDWG